MRPVRLRLGLAILAVVSACAWSIEKGSLSQIARSDVSGADQRDDAIVGSPLGTASDARDEAGSDPSAPVPAARPVDASTDLLAAIPADLSSGSLRFATAQASLSWPPVDVRIVVEKGARRLTVLSGERALVRWRVGLGGPAGDKVREGDRATPEGTYRVVTRNERSRFHLFLGLSYPDTAAAERGLAAGQITEAQARAIRRATAQGTVPPWNTPLGGAIGLHGGGGGTDWTLGCIAVEDVQIEELWEAAPLGTPVIIFP